MKYTILTIFLILGLTVRSQDISVLSQISKKVEIENVQYRLTVISIKDVKIMKTDQIDQLSKDRLLNKLQELGIDHKNNKLNLCQIIPNVVSSSYVISSKDKDQLRLLEKFIEKFSNCEFKVCSYDIIDEEETEKVITNDALNESKLKATKIAKNLNLNLGKLKVVKLVREDYGRKLRDFNLNMNLGWTAYPPSTSIRRKIIDDKDENSIYISKVYEFTFETN